MIEKMKTVTLVCLKKDQETALDTLRDLKLMHVKPVSFQASRKLADVQRELDSLTRIINVLAQKEPTDDTPPDESAETLLKTIHDITHAMTKAREERDPLARTEELLLPWGNFDPELFQELRDNGLDLRLCQAAAAKLPELPEGAVLYEINRIADQVYFIVVSPEPLDMELPEVNVSLERSLNAVRERKAELSDTIRDADSKLAALANAVPILEAYQTELMDEEEFLTAMERMDDANRLVTLTGYIPSKRTGQLKEAALAHGWAYRITDPEPDDMDVPTLITTPRWLRVSKPLFDFVGITPGYREFDISAWFLIFFTIFFAIIVGDGGYGLLFLVGTLLLKRKAGPSAQVAVNLLFLLSFFTVVWGFLTGNFFGIDPGKLPAFMQGIDYFTGANQQANTQYFCFLIGAIHLTIGHGIKMSAVINSTMALAQFGWMAIIWGYFFLGASLVTGSTFPEFAKYLLAGGAVLVIVFSVPAKNILKSIGGGLGELLGSIVNSFVDVLSYIRLFAVGLSSYYVAVSFNNMGTDIGGAASGVLAIPLIVIGALVIVFGHTLNIALCGLSVLVHGIRLNTLEFSGHVGLEWTGVPFRAFRKRIGSQ